MGEGRRDVKGIVGIDPNAIEGDAQKLRQGVLGGIAEGDEPTLEEVWARDDERAAGGVLAGLGSEATALTTLEEAFPGLEIVD